MAFLYRDALCRLLSREYNCAPEDFLIKENVLTAAKLSEGRRMYSEKPYFFHMVTLGGNAVVTADPVLHPFLSEFIRGRAGHWLFEIPNLLPLEAELRRHGYTLSMTHHMFLPQEEHVFAERTCPYPVRWFYDEDIHPFYGDSRFPNAICTEYNPNRPDRLVACLYDGEEIIAMAGGSEDAPGWVQIGIDVSPAYRSRGLGTYLVSLVKARIAEQGMIPFYGTSISNYHSWNIAWNCGFRPAFVEIGASRCPEYTKVSLRSE